MTQTASPLSHLTRLDENAADDLMSPDERLASLEEALSQSTSPEDEAALVERLCAKHMRRVHDDGLLLYAGCNEISGACRRMLSSGLGGLPAMGRPGKKDQPGTAEISALEVLVERQLLSIFGGAFAEARLPSCTMCNAALYETFAGRGGTIAALGSASGAHISSQGHGTPRLAGSTVIELPFDPDSFDIDIPRALPLLDMRRPPLVIIGASVSLRALSVREIAACCHSYGGVLAVDVAHIAGLIAGKRMPNPLSEGADFITGSTYKSLGGPPGGFLIGASRQYEDQLRDVVCPVMTSNYDSARIAALAVALAETKRYMPDYAAAMIANASALTDSCEGAGLSVVRVPRNPFPTHQLIISAGDRTLSAALVRDAERVGIILGSNATPGRPGDYCLRLGTQVLTRRGMGRVEMGVVADMLKKVFRGDTTPALGRQVRELTKPYQTIHYGFA